MLLARGIPEDNYAQSKEAEDLQNLCYNNLGIQLILNYLKRNLEIVHFPRPPFFGSSGEVNDPDPKLFSKSVLITKI